MYSDMSQSSDSEVDLTVAPKKAKTGGRPVDPIWALAFIRDPPKGATNVHAICKACDLRFAAKGIDLLYSHIIDKCNKVKSEVKDAVSKLCEKRTYKDLAQPAPKRQKTAESGRELKQASLKTVFETGRLNSALLMFVVMCNVSFMLPIRYCRVQSCNTLCSGLNSLCTMPMHIATYAIALVDYCTLKSLPMTHVLDPLVLQSACV